MVTVTKILREGAGVRRTEDGYDLTGQVTVSGITARGWMQLLSALNAPGVPAIGAPHPHIPEALLIEQRPEPQGKGIVKVHLTWRSKGKPDDPEDKLLEVGASLQSVETNKDVKDTIMTATYIDFSATPPVAKHQDIMVSVMRPHMTRRVQQTERADPGTTAAAYVGKVNAAGQFSLAGNPLARTWLCTSIIGRSSDKGKTYQVSYEFEYAPETWDVTIRYSDPETGRLPQDVIDRPGVQVKAIKTYQVYKEANFNALRLK